MSPQLKRKRGGFLRAFGCGWFIREFLLGHGPFGTPAIDPIMGAPQADIFYSYKMALMKATAADRATRWEEQQARREKRIISPDNIAGLIDSYTSESTYKANGCRYHSFITYFSSLRRLGWVEHSGREEASSFQVYYASAQPRRYYCLTNAGKEAGDAAWANPLVTLYGNRHERNSLIAEHTSLRTTESERSVSLAEHTSLRTTESERSVSLAEHTSLRTTESERSVSLAGGTTSWQHSQEPPPNLKKSYFGAFLSR